MKLWLIGVISFLASLSTNFVEAKENTPLTTDIEVITSNDKVALGQPFSVLVKISPQDGWHIYWDNPGDIGEATNVEITSSHGKVVAINHSAPKYFFIHKLITQYAYDEPAYWLFDIIPNNDNINNFSFDIDVSLMSCRDECISQKFQDKITLEVASSSSLSRKWEQELFKAQKTFPQDIQNGYFELQNDEITINIENFSNTSDFLRIVPFQRNILNDEFAQVFRSEDNLLIGKAKLFSTDNTFQTLEAVILTQDNAWKINLQNKNNLVSFEVQNSSFIIILIMAFIGGIILNLMPCIFPILFLKAINILQDINSIAQKRIEALLYFIGIIFSFLLIAGILWILRLGGENIGWGFQLQSPWFVGFMLIIFLIITFMFLGIVNFNSQFVNRLGNISVKNSYLNAFLTGLFAVLVASPCSAPFMGVAIGYSIAQPWYVYFPTFISLAVGYALPFTLLGLFPQKISKILPKPGKWMDTLKKLFAIPVFLTCIWLGWILFHQLSNQNIEQSSSAALKWQSYDTDKLQNILKERKPVFIVFTAKWCLTCLVNEKLALDTKEFENIVKEKNITLLKADWTNKDENITSCLADYGRNSVPLYVYYNGTDMQHVILPQILSPGIIAKYLN